MATSHGPAPAWPADELERIGSAEELEISSLRRDGTVTEPVVIWVVEHAGQLYIRSWKGSGAAWFRAAQVRHEGRIAAGGVQKDVSFEKVGGSIDDAVDAAFRSKYRRHGGGYVDEMVAPPARETTLKLVPRPG